ncbi:hypothetical protein FQR65_LT13970 [Abscondita terminalis]|nr:hypothetical protein FQR65_LT13970 [Abscondita terminalis]
MLSRICRRYLGTQEIRTFIKQYENGFDGVIKKVNIIKAENGVCLGELKVDEEHLNPMHGLHGGLMATIVDCMTSYALITHKKSEAVPSVSVDLNMTKFEKGMFYILFVFTIWYYYQVCVVGVGDGRCTAEMEVCPEHLDASKNMHPGMTATLIDSFTSFALLSHKSHEGIESQPVDMYITFFHTPTCGDVITIEGDCLKVGPRLAFTSCTITNKCNGTLLALAAHTKYYMTIIQAENGKCVAELKIDKEHTNSKETLHGGLIMTLVDNVTTYALKTNLKSVDTPVLSTNLNVKFLNKANIGDTISILGEVIKCGKTMGFMSCTVAHKGNGSTIAKGNHTMYIVSKDQRKS